MRGDERVVEFLNEQLTAELTAINQYFLHAKMQENFGWVKLARYTRSESIDEMRHAERLTDRILFLDGLPNYQRLNPLRIGQTVREMFEADLAVEMDAVERLRPGIDYMRSVSDVTSANIFEDILADEEATHRLPRDPARAAGQPRRAALPGPAGRAAGRLSTVRPTARSGTRGGSWCPAGRVPAVRPAGSGGSTTARTDASRPS